jgi:hypothetical protein
MVTVMYAVFQLMILTMRAVNGVTPGAATAIGRMLDSEWILVLMVYAPILVWLAFALRRVYGGSGAANAAKTLALVVWHVFMLVVVFRFLLFFTTFYSIKWFG